MAQREIPGQLGGVDILGRLDEPLGDRDGESIVRVVLAEFLAPGQQRDRLHQRLLPSQAQLLLAQVEQGLQAGW